MKWMNHCIGIVALLLLSSLSSCHVEKRIYQRGWHVEWPSSSKHSTTEAQQGQRNEELESHPKVVHTSQPNDQSVDDVVVSTRKVEFTTLDRKGADSAISIGLRGIKRSTLVYAPVSQPQGQKQVHSKASLSLVFGILAMGCVLAPILISGLGLAVIIGLVILLIVFALLAQKMSRMALEDMHMARNRYAGKAMAVAGMILSVLALVALIGISLIALLGLAFLSFV